MILNIGKGAYGIKILKRVVKEIQNMTSEEYTDLYERCMRDIKECPEILDMELPGFGI